MKKSVHRVICIALGLTAFGTPAVAGGYDTPHTYNWGGFYFGLQAGYASGDSDFFAPAFDVDADGVIPGVSFDNEGGIVGGQLGLQRQYGQWVFGVEAAAFGMQEDDENKECLISGAGVDCSVDVDWVAMIGPKIGYARDRWLGYAKGGYAIASIDSNINPIEDSANEKHDGWFAGVGIEYALMDDVVFGIEYTHINIEGENHGSSLDPQLDRDVEAELDSVQARISFKLGGHSPAPAPLK